MDRAPSRGLHHGPLLCGRSRPLPRYVGERFIGEQRCLVFVYSRFLHACLLVHLSRVVIFLCVCMYVCMFSCTDVDESLTDPIVLADESAEERLQYGTPHDTDMPCALHGFTRCLVCRVTAQYQAPETRGGVCSLLTFW